MRVNRASSAATSSTCKGCLHSGQETSGCSCPSCANTDFSRHPSQNACPHTVRTGCQNGSQQMGQVNSERAGSSACCRSFFISSSGASSLQMLRAGSSAGTFAAAFGTLRLGPSAWAGLLLRPENIEACHGLMAAHKRLEPKLANKCHQGSTLT